MESNIMIQFIKNNNMKYTAIRQAIDYFRENQNMPSDVLIIRLVDKLIELEAVEINNIRQAYNQRAIDYLEKVMMSGDQYYSDNYESTRGYIIRNK